MNQMQSLFTRSGSADIVILVIVSVLLLTIIWQAVARIADKRALANWQKDLFYAMAEGLELEVTAGPKLSESSGFSGKWRRDVQAWITQTGTMLERHSAQAGISFRYAPRILRRRSSEVAGPSEYKMLLLRLKNLRNIIEHPDAYL